MVSVMNRFADVILDVSVNTFLFENVVITAQKYLLLQGAHLNIVLDSWGPLSQKVKKHYINYLSLSNLTLAHPFRMRLFLVILLEIC